MNKTSRRYYRTILLGLMAMAVLIWAAMDQFGISTEEMTTLFFGALLVLGVTVICAALFTALWMGLRRVRRRDDGDK